MKTKSEVEKLSLEQRRVATAELCGYSQCESDGFGGWYGNFTAPHPTKPDKSKFWMRQCVPDYLSDLNAMAEAEKIFVGDNKKQDLYINVLLDVILTPAELEYRFHSSVHDKLWCCVSATAQQRNLAFLMVMMEDKE